jgi:hypothetical protein
MNDSMMNFRKKKKNGYKTQKAQKRNQKKVMQRIRSAW